MATEFESEREQATHITGDYYWYDEVPPKWWAVAAVLSIGMPPVGVFLVTYFGTSAIRSEDSLDDGPEPAIRPVD